MNWLGDIIQKHVRKDDVVLDLGCGIMQATLGLYPAYPNIRLKCKKIIGVDVFYPYLEFLDSHGIDNIKWDLRNTPLPFEDKSVDVILLTDVLEHLDSMDQVVRLLLEADRIARRKIIISAPKSFNTNFNGLNAWGLGYNKYQLHNINIDGRFLKAFKYKFIKGVKKDNFVAVKRLNLKILHLYDTAGVGAVMCEYQRRLGHIAHVFNSNKNDVYGFGVFYNNIFFNWEMPKHKVRIIEMIRNQIKLYFDCRCVINKFKPDIIHFHALEYIIMLFPFKKRLIEFHGTRIRTKYVDGTVNRKMRIKSLVHFIYRMLKIPCFVSTKDLLKEIPLAYPRKINKYIPNPVDTEHFEIGTMIYDNKALYSHNHYESTKRANNISIKYNWKLTILPRLLGVFIPYKDFPSYLKNFNYYIDRHVIDSLSKTALECLAMGIKVVDWKNDIITELPEEHYPLTVARNTVNIYRYIMENGK